MRMFGCKEKEFRGESDKSRKIGHYHTDPLLDVAIFIK